jgi:Raf kinase inhibitor-like YbhB/YbcL family protein
VSIFGIGRRTGCTPPRVVNGVAGALPACLIALAAAGCGSGGGQAQNVPLPQAPGGIALTSPAFSDGGSLPRRYTCDGAGDVPPLRIAGVPAKARELALLVDDPDAPGGEFPHWELYGLPPSTRSIDAGNLPSGAREGRNGLGRNGYAPPCPPGGDEPHHYVFVLYALSAPVKLPAGASADDVLGAVTPLGLARGVLTGRYAR